MTAPPTTPTALPISGTTRLYAVIGDPVTQVQAPALLNPLFARLAMDAVLIPVQAHPRRFATVLEGLEAIGNLDGVLVTIPHKIAACTLASERSTAAAISGSANVLRRAPGGWRADNFDGAGFVRGLTAAGHPPRGARVALLGAGGAGSAIAVALLEAGCGPLAIHDPDQDKCADLVARLDAHWPGRTVAAAAPVLGDADLAVNATPLGLRPDDPLPFPPDALPAGCVVADIIMKPARTRLLAAAATLGLPTHPGIHMLAEQLDLYRSFFGLIPAQRA
ncbi:Shikimate dehydrogenase [Frankia canadensis]|uniref:Shikimate dehydrogenase n=1 Tax=Frankia canadensis TaxID=1836972 RepID=A0A2I2KWG3_9ACTN|nr:shikimate dehydrogenase [Frankia canadensis]SNQ50001.1 Shikimate dehydrogenase [Frankia canadensis]SOU57291.1 Shikimate dehydrogenase [Frankia canadensis]